MCQVGFPQRGFFHTVVQFLCSLDVLVSETEALRQGFNEYSSWPTWPQHCIDEKEDDPRPLHNKC